MQNIHLGDGVAGSTLNAVTSGVSNIVLAASNVRGVIIYATQWEWSLSAASSQIVASISAAGLGRCHQMYHNNGAGGIINQPRGALFQQAFQFGPGVDIRFEYTITGTVVLNAGVTYKVL